MDVGLPADAEFEVGDRIGFEEIGELTVTRVWKRENTGFRSNRDDPELLLVWLDDGSEKHTNMERIAELNRQYWRARGR